MNSRITPTRKVYPRIGLQAIKMTVRTTPHLLGRALFGAALLLACLFVLAQSAHADPDLSPPEVVISSPTEGEVVTASAPQLQFDAFDVDGDLAGVTCQIDAQAPVACAAPEFSPGELDDGAHSFEVVALDDLGASTTKQVSFTIDTSSAPVVSISAPADGETLDASPVSVEFTATDADDDLASVSCKLDAGDAAACNSPFSTGSLDDGAHSVTVTATDDHGNVGAETVNFSVETPIPPAAPVVTITAPAYGSAINASSVDVEFTATDADDDIASVTCKLDAASAAACTSPFNTGPLSDGLHSVAVTATDSLANVAAQIVYFTIDTTIPDTSINSGPAPFSSQTTADFTFNSDELDASFECKLDAGNWATCSSPLELTSLTDGDHQLAVRAIDDAGNTDATPDVFSWQIDRTPPDTTFTTVPPARTNSTSAIFEFTSNEPGSFECRIDSGAWNSCSSGATVNGLSEGNHTGFVRAVDRAGNRDTTPASTSWTIDTTAPAAPLISTPADNSTLATTTPAISGTAEANSLVSVYDGTDLLGATYATGAGNWTLTPASPLTGASHSFSATAADDVGNTSAHSAAVHVTIDVDPPDTDIDTQPNSLEKNPTATFTFSSDDPTATFECRIDSGSFAACSSPFTTPTLLDGSHTFSVRAKDLAGNIDPTPASFSWTIDTTGPPVVITGHPALNDTAGTFTFGSSEAPVGGFECRLDATPTYSSCSSPVFVFGLAVGSHTFRVRGSDPLGNMTTQRYTWVIDLTPPATPTITTPAGTTATNDSSPTIAGHAEAGATVRVYDFTSQLGSTTADLSGDWSFTPDAPLADKTYTLRARAIDAADNYSGYSGSRLLTVDTAAPTTTIGSHPTQPSNQTTATFDLQASETGITYQCKLDGSAWSSCADPAVYSGLSAGDHSFKARAIDAVGNVGDSTELFCWTIDLSTPSAPAIVTPASPAFTTDATPTLSGTAEPAMSVRIFVNGTLAGSAPTDATSGDWTFTPTTNLAQGTLSVTAKTVNAAGTESAASAVLQLTIDSLAPSTTIDSGPPAATNATTADFTFHADDPLATFECKLDGGAYLACSSPHHVSALAAGSHTISIRASDVDGNVEIPANQRSWLIDQAAPVGSVSLNAGSEDSAGVPSFTISSDGGGADATACKIDSGAFVACGSPFRPAGVAPGNHALTVRFTDPAGNESTRVVAFAVVPPITPPTGDNNQPAQCTVAGFTASDAAIVDVTGGSSSRKGAIVVVKSDSYAIARVTVKKGSRKLSTTQVELRRGTNRVALELKNSGDWSGNLSVQIGSLTLGGGHGVANAGLAVAKSGRASVSAAAQNASACGAEGGARTKLKLKPVTAASGQKQVKFSLASSQLAVARYSLLRSGQEIETLQAAKTLRPTKFSSQTLKLSAGSTLAAGTYTLIVTGYTPDGARSTASRSLRVR
jgi:hypothetical protein